MLQKIFSCQNNPNSFTLKTKAIHEPSSWTTFTNCLFYGKLDYYRGIDCIKELCKKFKDHALKIINYAKKEMIPLSEEENKSYEEEDVCQICRKNSDKNDKNNKKFKDHCH